MTHPKLTGTESAVMFVLMARAEPVSNPQLKAGLGPQLEKPNRQKLVKLGLIETSTGARRTIFHTLTDAGWAWCAAELETEAPTPSTPPLKALYTVLAGLGRHMRASDLRLYEVFTPPTADADSPAAANPAAESAPAVESTDVSIADRIRASYRSLASAPGAWVTLTELRSALGDVARADLDPALVLLQRTAGVSLIPQENQKLLTDTDRDAAVVVGTQKCHLLAIETA